MGVACQIASSCLEYSLLFQNIVHNVHFFFLDIFGIPRLQQFWLKLLQHTFLRYYSATSFGFYCYAIQFKKIGIGILNCLSIRAQVETSSTFVITTKGARRWFWEEFTPRLFSTRRLATAFLGEKWRHNIAIKLNNVATTMLQCCRSSTIVRAASSTCDKIWFPQMGHSRRQLILAFAGDSICSVSAYSQWRYDYPTSTVYSERERGSLGNILEGGPYLILYL